MKTCAFITHNATWQNSQRFSCLVAANVASSSSSREYRYLLTSRLLLFITCGNLSDSLSGPTKQRFPPIYVRPKNQSLFYSGLEGSNQCKKYDIRQYLCCGFCIHGFSYSCCGFLYLFCGFSYLCCGLLNLCCDFCCCVVEFAFGSTLQGHCRKSTPQYGTWDWKSFVTKIQYKTLSDKLLWFNCTDFTAQLLPVKDLALSLMACFSNALNK